jgi:hypothetical protein
LTSLGNLAAGEFSKYWHWFYPSLGGTVSTK